MNDSWKIVFEREREEDGGDYGSGWYSLVLINSLLTYNVFLWFERTARIAEII